MLTMTDELPPVTRGRMIKRSKRKLTKVESAHRAVQRSLVSVGEYGPTPERAAQAGDPLIRHETTGEMRRKPGGSMEPIDAGGVKVAKDTLTNLHKRCSLAPRNPDLNAAMLQAGQRLEGLIYRAGMTGSVPSPNLMGSGGGAPGSMPYVRSLTILEARDEIARIRSRMARRDWEALEWCILTGFTVERGGQMLGGGRNGEVIFLDRLRGGLEWLVESWGMMTRPSRIRAMRA